jgi:hypothetical protein
MTRRLVRSIVPITIAGLVTGPAVARGQVPSPPAASATTVVRAARMIDPKSGNVMQNPVIVVRGGRIVSVGANAAQLTVTNGPSWRSLARCSACATSSLPEPVSPWISTVEGQAAAR